MEGAPKLTFCAMVSKDVLDPVWPPPVIAECCNMTVPRSCMKTSIGDH